MHPAGMAGGAPHVGHSLARSRYHKPDICNRTETVAGFEQIVSKLFGQVVMRRSAGMSRQSKGGAGDIEDMFSRRDQQTV